MIPINLALIGQVVSEKKIFEYFCNIHVYCPGVGADQPLWSNFFFFQNYQPSVHLPISCKFCLSNNILTIFPIQMHGRPMLTLPINRSRSSKGHNLYTRSTPVPDASCQVSLKSVQWFRRRRILKGFHHIWAWRPSWSCDLDYL